MNTYFKNILIYSLGSLILISSISFRALRLSERKVTGIQIEIMNDQEFYLIDQIEIQALLNKEHSITVLGSKYDQVDFKLLEKQVEENPLPYGQSARYRIIDSLLPSCVCATMC